MKHDDLFSSINTYCSESWKIFFWKNSTQEVFEKNQLIFREGDSVKMIHFIVEGKVKIYRKFGDDGYRIIRLASNSSILGHRGLGEKLIYPITAETYVTTKVLNVPIDIFMNLLKCNPEFCFHFTMFLAQELKISENHMKNSYIMPVRKRVIQTLYSTITAFGFDSVEKDKLSFSIPRSDIANMAGTRYESVIRVLADLSKEKIIKIEGKSFRILNEKAIQSEINSFLI